MTIESLSPERPTAEAVLREVAGRGASGVLEIHHPDEAVSHVWFRDGRVYAMHVPGYRPALGIRMLSGGLVTPEQLSAAAAAQHEHYPTLLIGQVLVGMGFVGAEVVDTFVLEQVLDQVADLLDLPIDSAAFHPGRRVQHDVIAPAEVDELLMVARQRRARRSDVLACVGGPGAVPQLGAPGAHPNRTPLGPYDWALLCRVDGRRDITELARVCGFTVLESAQIVADLTLTGLLVLPPPPAAAPEPLAAVLPLRPNAEPVAEPVPDWRFDGTDAGEPEPVLAPDPVLPVAGPAPELLAELSAFVHDAPLDPVHDAPLDAVDVAAPMVLEPVEVPGPVEAHPAPEPVEAVAPPEPVEAFEALAPAEPVEAVAPPEPVEAVAPPEPVGVEAAALAPAPAEPASAQPAAQVQSGLEPVGAQAPTAPPPQEELAEPPAAPDPQPHPAPALVSVGATTSLETAEAELRFPAGAPVAPPDASYNDTSVFMRELSSLSDAAPTDDAPVVTRLVVPLTPQPRKRRFWAR